MYTKEELLQVSKRTLVRKKYGDLLHIAAGTGTLCALREYPEELIFTVPKNPNLCFRCMAVLEKENADEAARRSKHDAYENA